MTTSTMLVGPRLPPGLGGTPPNPCSNAVSFCGPERGHERVRKRRLLLGLGANVVVLVSQNTVYGRHQ